MFPNNFAPPADNSCQPPHDPKMLADRSSLMGKNRDSKGGVVSRSETLKTPSRSVKRGQMAITVDAGMYFNAIEGKIPNAGKIVSSVVTRVVEHAQIHEPAFTHLEPQFKESLKRILSSLIWPFACRVDFTTDLRRRDRITKSFQNTFHTLCEMELSDVKLEDRCQTFVKYWHDLYLVNVFHDPTPPDPPGFFPPGQTIKLYTGWLKNYVDRRILRRDVSFISSLQKGVKQAWPPLGPYSLIKNLLKNFDRLTLPQRELNPVTSESISIISKEIFQPEENKIKLNKLLPTMSACFQNPVLKGGNLGMFMHAKELKRGHETIHLKGTTTVVKESAWWRREYAWQAQSAARPVFTYEGGNLYTVRTVTETKGRVVTVQIPIGRSLTDCVDDYRNGVIEECRAQIGVARGSVDDAKFHAPLIQIVPIYEPGKIRIISKGDGFMYTAIQPVQGHFLSSWKRHYASTFKTEDLTDRVNGIYTTIKEWLGPDSKPIIASVDFEAATDLMKSKCTEAALRDLDFQGISLLKRSFEPVSLCYGKEVAKAKLTLQNYRDAFAAGEGTKNPPGLPDAVDANLRNATETPVEEMGELKKNTEGQLMGHPGSFPILCCVNLSVYFLTIEQWLADRYDVYVPCVSSNAMYTINNPRALRRAGYVQPRLLWNKIKSEREMLRKNVIINGDDCFFVSPDEYFLVLHRSNCDEVSLRTSKGKDYRCTEGGLINSQFFRRNEDRLERVDYLNQRFIFGNNIKKKSSGKPGEFAVETVKITDLTRDINRMVKRAKWTRSAVPACLERFSKPREDEVIPNWYLPVHLGGLGLDPCNGPRIIKVTKQQRILAAQFVNKPELSLYRSKGVLPAPKIMQHLVPQCKLVVGDYVMNMDETEESIDPWSERVAYYNQCRNGMKRIPLQKEFEILATRIRKDYRLKPIGEDTLLSYWRFSRYIYEKWIPECPSLKEVNLLGGLVGDVRVMLSIIGAGKFNSLPDQLLDYIRTFL